MRKAERQSARSAGIRIAGTDIRTAQSPSIRLDLSVVIEQPSVVIFSLLRRGREFDGEAAAVARGAADQYSAAVRFDDMFDDAQADARTLGLASQLGAASVKALEAESWQPAGLGIPMVSI